MVGILDSYHSNCTQQLIIFFLKRLVNFEFCQLCMWSKTLNRVIFFGCDQANARNFEIAEDMFWKDGEPFQIIGGDLHYFRVLPEVFLYDFYCFAGI